jgi:glutathione S-transferase
MVTVHGVPASPFVRKVRLVLEEKGVAYQINPVVPFPKTPELLEISPLGKIPILEDDGFITPDSTVICAYLERTHPEPRLYPADSREFALALWYEEYVDTRLAEIAGTVFFQRIVRPMFFKEATDVQLVGQALTESLPPILDYLERHRSPRERGDRGARRQPIQYRGHRHLLTTREPAAGRGARRRNPLARNQPSPHTTEGVFEHAFPIHDLRPRRGTDRAQRRPGR